MSSVLPKKSLKRFLVEEEESKVDPEKKDDEEKKEDKKVEECRTSVKEEEEAGPSPEKPVAPEPTPISVEDQEAIVKEESEDDSEAEKKEDEKEKEAEELVKEEEEAGPCPEKPIAPEANPIEVKDQEAVVKEESDDEKKDDEDSEKEVVKEQEEAGEAPEKPAAPEPTPISVEDQEAIVKEESEEEKKEDEDSEEEKKEKEEMKEHIAAILRGGNLSEEFRSNVETIFEAAVKSKAKEIREHYEAVYSNKLQEATKANLLQLEAKVDGYISHVAETFLKENQIAIEHGLRSQIAEDVVNDLKAIFENRYMSLPEEKIDIVEKMSGQIAQLEQRLSEEAEMRQELRKENNAYRKAEMINEMRGSMSDLNFAKFKALAEEVEFDSQEKFQKKVTVLKESYFPTKKQETQSLTEDLSLHNGGISSTEMSSPLVEEAKKILARLAKK